MNVPFKQFGLEDSQNLIKQIYAKIVLKGNTTAASIYGYCDNVPDVRVYTESSGQPTPADSDANFGTLDSNAAPSTVGVLVLNQDADEFVEGSVLNITSASMTAGVITKAGGGSDGVTSSYNLAVVISCTGLDLDAAVADHTFWLRLTYKKRRG